MTRGNDPLVSVLMPVRNEEDAVEAALRSVLTQTFEDYEILVVDAMSTDRTVEIVTALSASEPRIKLLQNPDRLIPHGLNVGLAAARGTYVARVDAHSTMCPEYLALGIAEFESDERIGAVGGRRTGYGTGRSGEAIAAALSSPFGIGNSINHYSDEAQDTDHAAFGMYRTSVIRGLGGWDVNLPVNEDVDIDHRLIQAGYRIRYQPKMAVDWHVRSSLSALGRQYRRYGRGKAAMVRKNGSSAVRARHLAAPALVLWTGGAALAALTGHRKTALAAVAPYALGVAAATGITARKAAAGGPEAAPKSLDPGRLAGAFATTHFSWGLGFLEGYLLKLTPAAASNKDPNQPTPPTS